VWSDTFQGRYLIEETLTMPVLDLTLSVIRPTQDFIEENYDSFYSE